MYNAIYNIVYGIIQMYEKYIADIQMYTNTIQYISSYIKLVYNHLLSGGALAGSGIGHTSSIVAYSIYKYTKCTPELTY